MKGLKIVLWICAICCLLGFIIAALPWQAIVALYHWKGIQPPATEPTTVFMFRLCGVTCGMIGIFFVILARNPLNYGAMLLLASYGLLGFGLFCLVGGIRYGLPVLVYSEKFIFFVVLGILTLMFRKKAMQSHST
jgi:energy-converting hydrogenase Eha subunit C